MTLLVQSRAGYKNLCRLITAGALGKPKGETSVTVEQVAAHAEGLHVLTEAFRLLRRMPGVPPSRLRVSGWLGEQNKPYFEKLLKELDAAGLGIAYRAKPAVAARARHRIDHADLTALLYAQGYAAGEIIFS